MNQQKQQAVPNPQIAHKSPNKERFLLIFLIIALVLSVVGYSMTVDKYTDYEPPSTLSIDWYDYFKDSLQDGPSSNNAATSWPRWSAEYPYRAVFLGAAYDTASSSKLSHTYYYVIYSKQPTTDLFTFEYTGNRAYPRKGYIRAKITQGVYAEQDDIRVVYFSSSANFPTGSITHPSFWTNFSMLSQNIGLARLEDMYFDFDFYYDCTDKHQQNTQLLNVSGLRNITTVPYAYILECDDPPPGGSNNGSSSTGGSSSGGSSSGSSGQKWGNGQYGGGIDWGGKEPSIKDGGSYSLPSYNSRDDININLPVIGKIR